MFSVNCQLPFPRICRESVKQTLFGISGVDADMHEIGYLSKHAAGTPYDSHSTKILSNRLILGLFHDSIPSGSKAGPRGKGKLMVVTL